MLRELINKCYSIFVKMSLGIIALIVIIGVYYLPGAVIKLKNKIIIPIIKLVICRIS